MRLCSPGDNLIARQFRTKERTDVRNRRRYAIPMRGGILFSLGLFGIRRRCKTELFHSGFGYARAQFHSSVEFDDLRQEAPIAYDSELYLLAQLWRAGGGGNTGDT